MNNGVEAIKVKRIEQIEKEGWTSEHDAQSNTKKQLLWAALCYIYEAIYHGFTFRYYKKFFPWGKKEWKKLCLEGEIIYTDKTIELASTAGALIAAEIDRLQGTKPLVWTVDYPKVDGYYWFKLKEKEIPCIVLYEEPRIMFPGTVFDASFEDFRGQKDGPLWFGPLKYIKMA